jgi:uncharacterized protein YsxB (DUF464 family)
MEVKIYKDSEGTVYGFQVSGHSELSPEGNDVLCSAVSALTITTVNAIETVTKDPVDVEAVNEEEGFLHFRLKSVSKESKLLLDSLVLGLQDIERSYDRYISVRFEEE